MRNARSVGRTLLLSTTGLIAALGLNTLQLRAQGSQGSTADEKAPAFEVASVKPDTGSLRRTGGPERGRFTTSGTLRQLIQAAYRRDGFEVRQVSGGPKWVDTDRFIIEARLDDSLSLAALYLPDGKGSAGLAYLMLRTLLADRFKLVVHTETQDRPVYALLVARRDRALGPQLRRSDVDCDAVMATIARTGKPVAPLVPGKGAPCSTQTGPGRLVANDIPLSQIADILSSSVDRVVLDRTGVAGNFDVVLEWSPDQLPAEQPLNEKASIFTGLQEQLGLKLESTKGPVDVLVIDHVERPTED